MKSNTVMATRGRPVMGIEERAEIEMARRRRNRATVLAEYAIGALAAIAAAAVMGATLIGFFTEPDPFYDKGPHKVEAPR